MIDPITRMIMFREAEQKKWAIHRRDLDGGYIVSDIYRSVYGHLDRPVKATEYRQQYTFQNLDQVNFFIEYRSMQAALMSLICFWRKP